MKRPDYLDYEDTDFDNFNITELKELERDKEVQNVIAINQQMKYLQQQKMYSLSKLAEEGISDKMFQAVSKVHKGILDSEIERHLSDILKESFEDKEELLFLLENKNKPFYKSSDIFDEYSSHKVQKVLVKDKLLSKRSIKKQKTAGQHITYVKQAKDSVDRISVMQSELDELKELVLLNKSDNLKLKIAYSKVSEKVSSIEDDLSETIRMLAGKINDQRKIQAFCMKQQDESLSNQSIAKILGVSKRTIERWLLELNTEVSTCDKNVA